MQRGRTISLPLSPLWDKRSDNETTQSSRRRFNTFALSNAPPTIRTPGSPLPIIGAGGGLLFRGFTVTLTSIPYCHPGCITAPLALSQKGIEASVTGIPKSPPIPAT